MLLSPEVELIPYVRIHLLFISRLYMRRFIVDLLNAEVVLMYMRMTLVVQVQ